MTETPTPYVAAPAYRDPAVVEALLDESFRVYGYYTCRCGATIGQEAPEGRCHPCRIQNRGRALYGGSLTPVVADVDLTAQIVRLSSRCADLEDQLAGTAAPCHDCAAVADASERLQAENSELHRNAEAMRTDYAHMTHERDYWKDRALNVEAETADALRAENSDLARQMVALQGRIVTLEELVVRTADERDAAKRALEEHGAEVRAGKQADPAGGARG